MTILIQNGSTGTPLQFLMVLSSDHFTGATGLSPTVTIKLVGASFGTPSGAVSEIANGWYQVAGNATDTATNGPILLHATAATADPSDSQAWQVVGFDPTQANLQANVIQVNGTNQTARDLGASVLLSAGTGTGQLDFTSGVVKANLAQILGTALTETAGQIAAAFKQFFNIASPTSTMNLITAVTTATNLTNAATAGDLTATMKTSVTTAATAATPTAAAVTGAVGSVTAGVTLAPSQPAITFVSQTITGSFTISDGLLIARSTANSPAISATGSGAGAGLVLQGGNAADASATGTGAGLSSTGGTGNATHPGGDGADIGGGDCTTTQSGGLGMVLFGGNNPGDGTHGGSPGLLVEAGALNGATGAVCAHVVFGNTGTNAGIAPNQPGLYVSSAGGPAVIFDATSVANPTTADGFTLIADSGGVNLRADVISALNTVANAEPTSVPAANASLATKIAWQYMKQRNLIKQTATAQTVYADDGTTLIGTSTVSDSGSEADRGKYS